MGTANGDTVVYTLTFSTPYFINVTPFSLPSLSIQPPSRQTMFCGNNCCDLEVETSNIEWGTVGPLLTTNTGNATN